MKSILTYVVLPLCTFLIGFFKNELWKYIYNKVIKKIKIKYYRKKLSISYNNIDDILNITTIAYGNPYFSNDEQIDVIVNNNKKFLLAFPQDLKEYLTIATGSFSDNDIIPFNDFSNIIDSNLFTELLETSRKQIAIKFLNREDGLYFNGKKYGVLSSDGFSRTCDDIEDPILRIQLFETDHFTHSVMANVFQEINKINKRKLTLAQLNSDYNIFRTSLGISIIIENPRTDQVIMTRRAKTASYSENKEWIYVSATETVTQTDYDRFSKKVDLKLCVRRAIEEELGITTNMIDESSIVFTDMFYENNFYQDGIVAIVKLKDNCKLDDVLNKIGKDSNLEIAQKFILDLDKNKIDKFIKDNYNEFRPQTLYSLHSFLSRRNIYINLNK